MKNKMKTEKTMDEKIAEAETFLPGINKTIKPGGWVSWGRYCKSHPEDLEFLETEQYKVVAVKWKSREWNDYHDGVGINEWVTLHYFGEDNELKEIVPEKIVVGDQYDSQKYRADLLFKYHYVGLEALADDKVEVAWVKHDGTKGPTYVVELK
ncbi:hypothetical protein HON71_03960 [Candidatus Woesearchaeota archaeon]|jgi:hypothetical protein|nr:hypothetical protein [archaeon]MBT4805301.1 hypothetical protein [Candidatus Woesearchaeota archaeon]